jgi:hypothetical protein
MSTHQRKSHADKERARRSTSSEPAKQKEKPTKHEQDKLDESLQETFPASDPIAPATPSDDPAGNK